MKQLFTCLLGWLLLAGPARAQSPDPARQQPCARTCGHPNSLFIPRIKALG